MREVIEAIGRQDFEVALVEAIAAWRHNRRALLADLVDAIAARTTPATIVGRDKESYQRAWLDLAKRAAAADAPASTGALAAGLVKSLPTREARYSAVNRDVKRFKHFIERIEALAKCADDPRVASALADVLEKAPWSVDDVGGVYGPAIDLLQRIGDERSVARLRGLVARPVAKTKTLRNYFADALPPVADAIERKGRKAKALADRETVEQLLAQLGAKSEPAVAPRIVDDARLLADCLAHPDDDGPREVLADVLLEREDPRGEFIQQQLRDARGNATDADRKRMASLQRKHEKEWLGDITRVTKLRLFRRGFLDEAELLQGAAADPATWKRVAADPILATIRTLHKGSASEELYKTFVFSPQMKQLRDYVVTSAAMLREFAGRSVDHILLDCGLTKDAIAFLDEHVVCKRLSFETKHEVDRVLDQIAAWKTRQNFVELCAMPWRAETWHTQPHRWLFAFDRLAPVKRLGIQWRGGDRIVVERTQRGVAIEIRASQEWLVVLATKLRGLPPVERCVLRGTPSSWSKPTAAFKRALKKLGAVDVHDGWRAFDP